MPDAEHTLVQPDYATKGVTYLKSAVIKAVSFVRKGANGERWLLYKSADELGDPTLSFPTPLIKRHVPEDQKGVWREAFLRVAVPGVADLQQDVWTDEEIAKAFESFVENGNVLNWDHGTMESRGRVNQNAIALADFEIETADGERETITKGTWYMSVIPDDNMRRDIESGLVGGMSVQGSAQRVSVDADHGTTPVAKADKADRPIVHGTTGEGILRLQNILGTVEDSSYGPRTEAALMEWMKDRGVPGIPTIATVKLVLSSPAATPAAAPAPPAVEAPVEGGVVPTEKGYEPANAGQKPGIASGAQGVNAALVNADSSSEDLQAVLAQSVREGNEPLAAFMEQELGGSAVADLYAQDVTHATLWLMLSKFILGNAAPSINAQGEYEGAPEVEKGAWTGSHGGHDPDAHKGGAQNFVRTFGEWARNDVDVAARKLLKHGVVKTEKAAYRLCFAAGTLVETRDRGQVEIEDLIPYDLATNTGDWVRTHRGHFRPVVSVVANRNEKALYTVTSQLNDVPIEITEDHNLLVARGVEFIDGTRTRKRSRTALAKAGIDSPTRSETTALYPKGTIGTVEWLDVQDIDLHDFLLFPKNREVVDRPEISDDFLWLVGMYAAEGSGICRTGEGNPSGKTPKSTVRTAPRWSFAYNEPIAAECRERLEREFGIEATTWYSPGSEVVGLYTHGVHGIAVAVTDKLATAVSGNQWTKRFADWILQLPEHRLRVVLDAYWAGDGHERPERNEAVSTTVSRDLAYQIRQMLVYVGERPRIKMVRDTRTFEIKGRRVNGSKTWTVSYNRNPARSEGYQNDDYIAFPIKSITKSHGPEWVYDVQIAEDNSLIANGVVAHNSAWLKDQYMGTTKWRTGNAANLQKSDTDLRTLLTELGEDHDTVVAKLADPALLRDEDPEAEVEKHGDETSKITAILQQGGTADELVDRIRAALQPTPESTPDPAFAALAAAVTKATEQEDPAARQAAVASILKDFARYMARGTKDSGATATGSATAPEPKRENPTFLNKGEDMDRTLIDDETAASLTTAVDFITNALGGGVSAEVPAEVEKDAVPDAFKGKKAPEFTADDAAPAADSPEAEGDLEEALDDEGEDVSEEELLQVMNHLVEEVDQMNDRLAALEQLDSKLDKVGELAKALTASDEVTEKVEKFAAALEEISKQVSGGATKDDMKAITGRVESVAKRLDGIAKTPTRSGAIPVDTKTVPAAAQAVAKSDTENIWGSPGVNPFR